MNSIVPCIPVVGQLIHTFEELSTLSTFDPVKEIAKWDFKTLKDRAKDFHSTLDHRRLALAVNLIVVVVFALFARFYFWSYPIVFLTPAASCITSFLLDRRASARWNAIGRTLLLDITTKASEIIGKIKPVLDKSATTNPHQKLMALNKDVNLKNSLGFFRTDYQNGSDSQFINDTLTSNFSSFHSEDSKIFINSLGILQPLVESIQSTPKEEEEDLLNEIIKSYNKIDTHLQAVKKKHPLLKA